MRLPQPPLLVITDRKQAKAPLADILEQAFAAGCRWASVREKDLPAAEQIALARELDALARRFHAILTLHGEAALAQRAGVGVHLPSGSNAVAARALLGPEALIGISIHSPAEAVNLDPEVVDYAVAGPVFETASKPGYGPTLGGRGLQAIADAAAAPIIAIGGITPDNTPDILAAGAAGVAVMGGLMRAPDPAAVATLFISALSKDESAQYLRKLK